MTTSVYYLVLCSIVFCEGKERLQVKTEYGPVMGRHTTTVGGNKSYLAFQGIPYAKPPLGNLRFAAPVPPNQWTDTLDATKLKSTCIEMYWPQGNEDCLYLNVYTPALNQSLPVIVWIHGGAFVFVYGKESLDGVDYFIEEDVVFVTIQYRLGVFGFLSTEDNVIPGNFGLKDQLFAIEWVHKNIHRFGGDASKITLMGQSSGAVSTSYLGMHRQLEGKIKGIIQHSGGSLVPFGLSRYARMGAYVLSSKLGIETTDSSVILKELRKRDSEALRNASLSTHLSIAFGGGTFHSLLFIPVREPSSYEGAFYSNMAYEELKRGRIVKVPRLMGITSMESLFMVEEFNTFKSYYSNYDEHIVRYLPYDMHSNSEWAAKSVKEHYMGNTKFTANMTSMVHFASDDQFVRPVLKEASLLSIHTPVFLYHFTYEGNLGKINRTMKGVEHGEELQYLFYGAHQPKPSEKDTKIRRMLVKLWANFAKHGNPTPTKDELFNEKMWLPINADDDKINCFEIGESPKIVFNPHKSDVQFWDVLYAKYGSQPYDTY